MTLGPQTIGIGPQRIGGSGSSIKQSLCQVSITHPSPAFTVAVTGTGDNDLDPTVYAANFVTLLNGYSEQLNSGSAFETQPDGRVKVLAAGAVVVSAYADIEHTANNTTAGAVFSIERNAVTILSPRSVHARLPNTGDIGNLAGIGSFNAQAGDIVGVALASDTTGSLSVRASSLVFEMFT